MSFLEAQEAAKRQRDMRLGKIPSAAILAAAVPLPYTVEPVEIPISDNASAIAEIKRDLDSILIRLKNLEVEPAPVSYDIKTVARIVGTYYNVPISEIYGDSKFASILRPRHVVMYIARNVAMKSFPVIGRALHKDHGTVHKAIKRLEALRVTDKQLDWDIRELTRGLLLGGCDVV